MFHLEAWEDGGGAHAEGEHVGDRGDGDGHSGVLLDSKPNDISSAFYRLAMVFDFH